MIPLRALLNPIAWDVLRSSMVFVNSIGQVIGGDDGNGNLILSQGGANVGTLDYVTGDWTYTGLDPLLEANYQYENISGTIVYSTGVIALAFSAAQTGSITAAYTYSATLFRQYIPVVADFAVSGGTLTFTPAALVPTGTGDTYGLMARRYPRWLLFQKLNEALRDQAVRAGLHQHPCEQPGQRQVRAQQRAGVCDLERQHRAGLPRDWVRITRYQQVNGRLQFYDWMIGDTIRRRYYRAMQRPLTTSRT